MANFALEPVAAVKRDYFLIGWMVLAHALAAAALWQMSWPAFAVFAGLYAVTACLGITFGFHRLLTHRSFKAPRWLERTAATAGTLALQGSPLEWVAHHRMHHAGSDTAADPHDASRGFWFSHIGWLFWQNPQVDDPQRLRRFARDIAADPYMIWLSQPVVMIGLQVALGLLLYAWGGLPFVLSGIFLRLVAVYHVTWFVNSASHMWGYRTYDIPDLATNNWWVGILAFGEGWHNNHHAQPDAVHVHRRWWELDMTWQLIRLLHALGVVSDLKLPAAHAASGKAAVAR